MVVVCGTLGGRKTCRSSTSSARAFLIPRKGKDVWPSLPIEAPWAVAAVGLIQIDRRWYGVKEEFDDCNTSANDL